VVYVIILASAFAVLGEVYGDLLRAAGATERLMELLDTHSPIRSPEQPVRVAAATAGTAVRFDAVEFHYPSRPLQPALHKFSMQVAPGETVALVGASGAGKSTVFQLMLRFYDPQQGTIRLGDTPIRDMALEDLRQRIGIVPQDAVIFSTSALENIRYGKPGPVTPQVRAAARAAFADEFIGKLPEGYTPFWVNGVCA
jgi:ATP-binding cassette subfamily B protein